jgi:hypothetical protein
MRECVCFVINQDAHCFYLFYCLEAHHVDILSLNKSNLSTRARHHHLSMIQEPLGIPHK